MNEEKLIKYLLQESDVEESKAVQDWIESDSENKKQFEQIKWIWDSGKSHLEKSQVDENLAWTKFTKLRDQKPLVKPQPIQRFMDNNWLRAAASITLILIATWVYTLFLPQSGKAYYSSVEFQSENLPLEIPLLDGTAITLNKNSQLSYSQKLFSGKRNVNMKSGEAYFDVKRIESKPFVIENDGVEITVLGTSFHVKSVEKNTEVIVTSGSVQVKTAENMEILHPNDKLRINRETGQMIKSQLENSLYNYYVSNKFHADRTPLQELVNVLNEAYDSKIVIKRVELKDLPITTTLEYGSLDDNLQVLQETLNLKISKSDDKIMVE
ncbi:FecR domain-containing protein [Algoriphagus sp. AGSA1]|uniref:FecR family protein n=1 Tax=Algoriphagus sp. AGSA1 TaxID=2907213 RepID=UPI001F302069|nr:FecR domain-containing protein [Algoriphagus sp. AGSA1]MCE7056076.1 FecR domain-containing protein [Algoriphagus sp. AGSA1]